MILRPHLSLSIRRRLVLLTTIPIIGLIVLGGVFLQRLYTEYTDVTSDMRTMAGYRSISGALARLDANLKTERELAFVSAVRPADDAAMQAFEKQTAATDAEVTRLLGEIDRLAHGEHAAQFEENAQTARDPLVTMLPDVRNNVRAHTQNVAKIMAGYAKVTYTTLRVSESYRVLIKNPGTLSFYDGIYTVNKMREQEGMVGSLFRLGADHAYAFDKDDLAVVRKQYAALTDSETYLRRYFPDLFTSWQDVLKTDETSVAYFKFFADAFARLTEGSTLAPFDHAGQGIGALMDTRYAVYTSMLGTGFSLADQSLALTARERKERAVLLSAAIIGIFVASIVVAIIVTRSTVVRLRFVSSGINQASGDVDAASEQLSSASGQMSQNATSYAAALEEIHATIEEIAAVARANSTHAQNATAVVTHASTSVGTGMAAIGELDAAMKSISSSSEKITQIISKIHDISLRTNILALNAAVEAARAGEAGAGFSVVADEVRKLAHLCADAATETAALIEGSTQNNRLAVGKSQDVARVFSGISKNVEEVNGIVTKITRNFQQQAQAIESVRTAVSQQDAVAQSTAAVAEETASSAIMLRNQVGQLESNIHSLDTLIGRSAADRAGKSADAAVGSATTPPAIESV